MGRAASSSFSNDLCGDKGKSGMEVKIISKEYIKPSTPTPPHLRVYQFSVLDQLSSHAYTPFVFFYLNNHSTMLVDVILERRYRLKLSLSETLTRFYPLAGELLKDNLHIECNDNGVYYVEVQVNYQLSDLLRKPKTKLIHQLLPYHPSSKDLLSKTCVTMIQVNFFSCGGIVIGLYTSHKIIDGYSATSFWKSWAATARGSSYQIYPSFTSSHIFPPNPSLPEDASLVMWPTLMGKSKCVARRIVFDASAIMALKAEATATSLVEKPSRVVVVLGLVWKCIMAASKAKFGFQKPSILSVAVNLRRKTSPALPHNSMGNILWFAVAHFMPNTNSELSSVVGCLQDALQKIDHNHVEELKGEEGSLKMREHLKKLKASYCENDADYIVASSLCNAGLYEIDFGWGEPTWLCHGSADADSPALTNLIILTDTKSGDGIEALVSLDEHNMRILEHDPELLAFASINSSPLESTISVSQTS